MQKNNYFSLFTYSAGIVLNFNEAFDYVVYIFLNWWNECVTTHGDIDLVVDHSHGIHRSTHFDIPRPD